MVVSMPRNSLLITLEFWASLVWTLRGRDHGQWGLQGEVQHRLRRQLDLLPLGSSLNASAKSTTGSSADGGALPTAGQGANDRANARTSPYLFRRVFAAG